VDGDLGTVEIERLGDSLWVLQLAGEHDLSTVPTIDAACERIAETGTTVVADLSEASFIDSTVIRALLRLVERGENLLLVAPTRGAVRRTLDLTGVSALLPVFGTCAAALLAVPPNDQPASASQAGA
jgi:anti-sigma B factor antagonist